jgi:hypothetical protein
MISTGWGGVSERKDEQVEHRDIWGQCKTSLRYFLK